MLKNYLRPEQAAEYLTNKTGDAYSLSDIKDLAIEDCINVLVYFNGGVTEFIFVESTFDDASGEEKNLDIYSFEGYFTSRKLITFLNYSGRQKMPYPINVYEILNASSSLRLERFIGVFPTSSKYPTTFRNTDNWPAMFNADTDLYICREQLDRLISKSTVMSTESTTPQTDENQPAEPITTLQAIGIMAELLALEDGCYKYRKGESNVNAKAIGVAVSNRAKARFGDNVRGFDSFNKKISEGLKALEKLEKK